MKNIIRKKILELRKDLHEIPELSGKETKTKQKLMRFIECHTDFKIVDKGLWFYVLYEEGAEETIGFRGDMDAVYAPDGEVKHACGHDGHSATLAGLILEVYDYTRKDNMGKNICFIFQYGEETGEGGSVCSQAIIENNISRIYAYHNIPGYEINKILLKKNTFACTSKGFVIRVEGAPAHAAYPEFGKNPSICIGRFLSALPEMINEREYDGMVLCTVIGVSIGSDAFGVSASMGEVRLTIRGEYEKDQMNLERRLRDKIEWEAKGEFSISYESCEEFPETKNDSDCVEELEKLCMKKGYAYEVLSDPVRWSEDFGYYLKKCKGAMIGVGAGVDCPNLHTATYEYPDDILESTVDFFFQLI